ncbi:MAG: ABC transporter substrate-binding protein, partial [Actinomycetota bacterium]
GVEMEIRAGGPFIGFSQPTAQMYADEEIFIAFADTGDQLKTYATLPAVGVVAPLEIGPQIVQFDPAQYQFKTVADVKASGATVLYFEGAAWADYMVGTGQLNQAQLDASYDGSPARWVASGGKVVQQGFATNEPYKYENDIDGWKKPVDFLLLHDSGWTIYQSNIVTRPANINRYFECFKKLVPMYQQSQVDYLNSPEATNNLILDFVQQMNTFWVLSAELNADAVNKMRELKVVSNGPDSTLGNYDFARIQEFMDTFIPILQGKGVEVAGGLTPARIATNEFIDPSIGL